MSRHLIALDQGTTSSRTLLFDEEGRLVDLAQKEHPQIYPKPGWVEHDPEAIWQTQVETLQTVLERNHSTSGRPAAIGITNQRETTLLWDRESGTPVSNAIVWQDRRTASFCQSMQEERGEEVRARTGLMVDAYFAASKIRWLLDQDAELRARAEAGKIAFGTIDTWLVWKLTGGRLHVTDVSNASRTLLFDIHRLCWDDELLEWFGVPRAVLPEVRPSSEVYGETEPELTGGAAVPIAGIAGDQQAALFGQGCHQPGMTKNTYGTGCFMLCHTGTEPVLSQHRLISTVAWQLGDRVEYALEGSVFIGGAVVQWLRDQLNFFVEAEDVEPLARSVSDSGGVVFVPAFAGLGAPHWDPHARGALFGLTRGTERGHVARAALEAIAYQCVELFRAMQADGGAPVTEMRVDGGAARNDFLMQFQADVLGLPVVRPEVTETTAFGAACLAGLAVGVWKDRDEVAATWRQERRFEPAMEEAEVKRRLERWGRAVERSRDWDSE